ncbi:hypothetical protein F8S13_22080 [Chloroflexia bacterium SDU3-3]|nr:hypothetical protein F8S13_22080 [Chloroflexia bacterium SDU3-3]
MSTITYPEAAQLAARAGAAQLASVFAASQPGQPLPPVPTDDPRPALDRLRRQIEQRTPQRYRSEDSKTWSYGQDDDHRVRGFAHLAHALVAGVRNLISPVPACHVALATRTDWDWLRQMGGKVLQLSESIHHYRHLPDADLLLLHYTEPTTFGQDQPAIAGACFFGAGVIGTIESHHRGGGHLLLTWMQARFPALLAHDVLTPQAAAFFARHGFAAVQLPLPEAVHARLLREQRAQREAFCAMQKAMGREALAPDILDDDHIHRRMLVWPADRAADPQARADELRALALPWWVATRAERQSLGDQEAADRNTIAFVARTAGVDITPHLHRLRRG